MNKVEKMVLGALVTFAVGMGLEVTGALAPIHEVGHVLCAMIQGSGGRIVAWNRASIDHLTNEVLVAGCYFELIVYFAVVLLARKKHLRIAAAAFGAELVNIGMTMRSTDIGEALLQRTDAYYVSGVLTIWALVNLAFLTWGGIALTMEIRKGAELLNASERSHKRQDAINTPSEETFFATRRETYLASHSRSRKKVS